MGWRGKNTNAIRLRSGDGVQHPVRITQTEPTLSVDEGARRVAARDRLAAEARAARDAQNRREKRRAADRQKTPKAATPTGWVPANRRADYSDPLARAADPRRNARGA